ncbi:VOC family protein [Pseudoalteromonas sp. S4488]|uniref:VOC family protein n=1 Tax=unclassified Pseudoalteromonas TaxID=194690 RepID=UPI001022B05B|nr:MULTISPECIES: VOC family protein [unclassified Pseudoalteromonas]RZF89619.1 VOC family protein [Pseudoalteromonas sp. CO109Y]TMO37710.1 VOC family protein [Pseudoalteromonas sp. S4491]TMO37939.1 VOC family protein [Pseudoalteromonas sp. S4488]
MTKINTKHPAGTFCWAELCAKDWQAAKQFYTQLFDWGFDDQPIGEDMYYTMLQKQGDDIAAMYQLPESMSEMPTHWLLYIAVDNVDQSTELAKSLGATVLAGPHDVMTAGRMVMLQEPGGATFALWQAGEHIGAKRVQELNLPYWFELVSKDMQKSRDFYCQLFGWQFEVKPMEGMDYTLFTIDEQPIAGMLEMTNEWPDDIPPHWMPYFAVADCDQAVAKATQLNGAICVPATDIPDVGRFSVITDPQGAVFSILKSTIDELT